MKHSVSATCLDQEAFEDSVLSMHDYPVEDLHCDYFPEIDTAPSLSADQIDWCIKHWARTISIHIWGETGLNLLPPSAQHARLLLQLHDASEGQIQIVHEAAQAGWQAGISLCPRLVPDVMGRLTFRPSAVQVLSTTTPGFPGGLFDSATWQALRDLRERRTKSGGEWVIMVDGGLTPGIMAKLNGHCDLAVIGTNYLRRHPATGRWVPDLLGEPACQNDPTV